jgi:hypothetical protein
MVQVSEGHRATLGDEVMATKRLPKPTPLKLGQWNVDNPGMGYRDKYDPRNREARLRHYYSNREQYYARNRAKKRQLRALLVAAKSKPCMDCGGSFPPVAMDFDHRDPTTKLLTPAHLPGAGSFRLMQEELAKCDLVCSNCHRLREESRRLAKRTTDGPEVAQGEPTGNDESPVQLTLNPLWS